MPDLELIATAAFGLESVVASELRDLGYENVQVENGRVVFSAGESAVARCNLWLRSADRLLIRVGSFVAVTFDELFDQTKALPWSDWLPADANFPVTGKSVHSQLASVPDCQAIVKKAIVEQMKTKHGQGWFPETGAKYVVEVALLKDVVTLTLDTSGAGLHKRGYRQLTSGAPLKETLAAALIMLSRWRPDRALIDPFCGSGTIPIEAALIGRNVAPGLSRSFAAEKWSNLPRSSWQEAREEARDLIRRDQTFRISGSDIDDEVLSLARHHAREAGVEDFVHFQRMPMSEIRSRQKYGYIICNPPYGERLSDAASVARLYQDMGKVFRTFDTWSEYVLTSSLDFERLFNRRADKKRKLYNGRIECVFYQFFGPRPPRRPATDNPEEHQD